MEFLICRGSNQRQAASIGPRKRCAYPASVISAISGLISLLIVVTAVCAEPLASREYQLKAVFLFNFARFVEWPAHAFGNSQEPIIIGVLGDDPFGAFLDQTVIGETVHSRSLMVRRYTGVDEIGPCHILFISRSESMRLTEILATLQGRSILTVGDLEGDDQGGVIIRFVIVNNKIRLRIDAEAAKSSHLTLSSKLLRPAEIVTARSN